MALGFRSLVEHRHVIRHAILAKKSCRQIGTSICFCDGNTTVLNVNGFIHRFVPLIDFVGRELHITLAERDSFAGVGSSDSFRTVESQLHEAFVVLRTNQPLSLEIARSVHHFVERYIHHFTSRNHGCLVITDFENLVVDIRYGCPDMVVEARTNGLNEGCRFVGVGNRIPILVFLTLIPCAVFSVHVCE